MVYILNVKMSFGWTCLGSKKLTMWLLKTHLWLKEVGIAEKWVVSRLCHSLWPWSGCVIL